MKFRAVLLLLSIGLLGAASHAQAGSAPPGGRSPVFGQNPEDAYLSPTRYTNAYFGFLFDFPATAELRPIPQPASLNRRIQLLEMIGSAAGHAAVSISAYEYKNKNYSDAKAILRQQLDQDLFHGVEELKGVSKMAVGGRQFFYYKTRRGVDLHVGLAAEMRGFVLDIDLAARDENVMQSLLWAVTQAEFFPPQEAREQAGEKASIYQGPAISEEHLREVRESLPGDHIDPGKVSGNLYQNSQIGMTFEFPTGWSIEPTGALEPAVERYREQVTGEPLLGPRERAVVKACRRMLISAWRTKPAADGEVPYDDFGEATLTAMPLSCFPNIRFPADGNDAYGVRQFILGLAFTQPLQRDMTSATTYESNGKTFVVTRGTIAYKVEGDALSRRVSVALAMTEQRGYLLIWLFAAPHESELRELLASKVSFEADAESQEAAASKPEAPPVARQAKTAEMQASSNAAAESGTSERTKAASEAGAAQAAFHPSLLAPGEQPLSQAGSSRENSQKQPN